MRFSNIVNITLVNTTELEHCSGKNNHDLLLFVFISCKLNEFLILYLNFAYMYVISKDE